MPLPRLKPQHKVVVPNIAFPSEFARKSGGKPPHSKSTAFKFQLTLVSSRLCG